MPRLNFPQKAQRTAAPVPHSVRSRPYDIPRLLASLLSGAERP